MTTRTTRGKTTGRKLLGLVPFGLAVLGAAVIGGLASADAGSDYQALDLPAWAPPAWLFGPAWGVLYVMIAVAGWMSWKRTGFDRATAMWSTQLVLNAAWTPLFFGAQQYWLAFAELCVMWVAIATTIGMFRSRSTPAAWLMVPYLGWVTFAGALNLAIAAAN